MSVEWASRSFHPTLLNLFTGFRCFGSPCAFPLSTPTALRTNVLKFPHALGVFFDDNTYVSLHCEVLMKKKTMSLSQVLSVFTHRDLIDEIYSSISTNLDFEIYSLMTARGTYINMLLTMVTFQWCIVGSLGLFCHMSAEKSHMACRHFHFTSSSPSKTCQIVLRA